MSSLLTRQTAPPLALKATLLVRAALMPPVKAGKPVPGMQLLLTVNWGNLCCHTPAGAQLLGQTSTLSWSDLRAPGSLVTFCP